MLASFAAVLPVFALILVGWAAGRRGLLAGGGVDALNGFVVRLALPVLLFRFVAAADWRTYWQAGFVAASAAGVIVLFGGTLLGARGRGAWTDRCIAALAAAYANTAFIGIPVCQALFGAVGLAAAVLASLVTVCALFAVTILLVEIDLHRTQGFARAAAGVARSVAATPMVIGPAAGAAWALTGLALPAPVDRVAALLGAAASPVALVTIGLFLAAPPVAATGTARRVMPLVALKLVGQPLVTLAFVQALGVPGRWGAAAVLIAALPTGAGPFMLARLYDRDAALIARVILVTTMLAAITIPVLAAWMVTAT